MNAERRGCTCVGLVAALGILVIAISLLIFWIAHFETATGRRGPVEPAAGSPASHHLGPHEAYLEFSLVLPPAA